MATWYPQKLHFTRLRNLTANPAHWRALVDEDQDWLNEISAFIARLMLLYGVPFKYLVPDSRMLPPESIRFFYVDPNWVNAIIDGALSLGRISEIDQRHDEALKATIAGKSHRAAVNLRRGMLAKPAIEVDQVPAYGGFLMRSAVVSGWPGLEVQAFADKGGTVKVEMLRMDRLADDVLLCLFVDRFERLDIHEPREGVTFGALPHYGQSKSAALGAEPESYTKQLRGLGIGGYPVGDPIDGVAVDVPLRGAGTRVVAMTQLRDAMEQKLESLDPPAWDAARRFTSAQFTLEMVQGASRHYFDNESPPASHAKQTIQLASQTRAADLRQLHQHLFEDGFHE